MAPVLDAKSDWELIYASEEVSENKTILRFSRLLNTCDDEDYPIGVRDDCDQFMPNFDIKLTNSIL